MNIKTRKLSMMLWCLLIIALMIVLWLAYQKMNQVVLIDSPGLKVIKSEHERISLFDPNGSAGTYEVIDVYVHGRKLQENDYSEMIYGKAADESSAYPQYTVRGVVVLDEKMFLLRTCYDTAMESDCRITRFYQENGKLQLEPMDVGKNGGDLGFYDAGTEDWVRLYNDKGDMLLVRKKPYEVHNIGHAVYLLLIKNDVAIVFDRDDKAMVISAIDISSGKKLADYHIDITRYESPYFDGIGISDEATRWFTTNFEFKLAPVPRIELRPGRALQLKAAPAGSSSP
jgi:hypothetical protein